MFKRIRDFLFGSNYAGLVAASLAASRAAFRSYTLKPETISIDFERATLQELVEAYKDCLNCMSIEYPETDEGCGQAETLMKDIETVVCMRFPEALPPEEKRRNRVWVQTIGEH